MKKTRQSSFILIVTLIIAVLLSTVSPVSVQASGKPAQKQYKSYVTKIQKGKTDIDGANGFSYLIHNVAGSSLLFVQTHVSGDNALFVYDCVGGKVKRIKQIDNGAWTYFYVYKNYILTVYCGTSDYPAGATVYQYSKGNLKKVQGVRKKVDSYNNWSVNSKYAKKVCKKCGLDPKKFKELPEFKDMNFKM